MICTPHHIFWGDQIKGMGGACSTYGEEERCMTGFRWGNLRERDHLEDPGVDGRKILRWIFRKWVSWLWGYGLD